MSVQAPFQAHAFDPQGGEVPVDGSVQRANAGFLAPGQTKISVCVDNIATTSAATYYVPLPTPPVGKVWMVTDLIFSHTVATGQRFAFAVGGITTLSIPAHGSAAPDIIGSAETQQDCPGGLQPVLQIAGIATMNSFATVAGVQQNMGAG
jgi:hypothetical protein